MPLVVHPMSFRLKTMIFAAIIVAGATFLILKGTWSLDKVGDTYTGINIPNDQAEPLPEKVSEVGEVTFARYNQPRDFPNITFYGPGQQSFNIANWQGRKLLINFWATWCAPCVEELPRLNLMKQELASRNANIDVITISMDTHKDFNDILAFLKRHKAGGLPAYMDSGREIMKGLNLSGFPVTYVLNEYGQEISRYEGPLAWDNPKVIEALLKL